MQKNKNKGIYSYFFLNINNKLFLILSFYLGKISILTISCVRNFPKTYDRILRKKMIKLNL